MAKGKKKGKRAKKSVALLPMMPPAIVIVKRVRDNGFTELAVNGMVKDMTGADIMAKSYDLDNAKWFWAGEIAAIVGHKVASKTKVNKAFGDLTEKMFGIRVGL